MTPFNFITDLIERFRFGDECRPSPALPLEPPKPEPPIHTVAHPRKITSVAAWTAAATLRNPEANVKAAAAMRLDRLDVMVADHSACRDPMRFSARPSRGRRAAAIDDLLRVGEACARHGVGLGLTTWVMPHENYLDGMAGYLFDAVEALDSVCPVTRIILDAEEPWTQARERMSFTAAGARLGRLLGPLQVEPYAVSIGLTGIGYARESALDPLAAWCDFAVPQVYATTRNKLDPRTSPRKFATRWTEMFERKEIAIGLPAYRQAQGAMGKALAGAREVAADPNSAACNEVIYWSLAFLRASAAKARLVTGIKGA